MTVTRGRREVIVNADDFGRAAVVNEGVVEAHERGIVTSASLMVRWPASAEAAAYARSHPELSVGLHVDLGEWVIRDGGWMPSYEVVALDDLEAVAAEIDAQLGAFREMVGQDPTHLDSHQHVHAWDRIGVPFLELAQRLGVPLRHADPRIRYCGALYGQTSAGDPFPQGVSTENLIAVLSGLEEGVTELCCHPGVAGDLDSPYRDERELELRALCDPRVPIAIAREKIELRSFAGLGRKPDFA